MKLTFLILVLVPCVLSDENSSQSILVSSLANEFTRNIKSFFQYFSRLATLITSNNNGKGYQIILAIAENLAKAMFPVPKIPRLQQDIWWGEDHIRPVDQRIRPFKVHFSEDMIQDLRSRLYNRKNFTKPLKGVVHSYGLNSYLHDHLIDYWKTDYDFHGREDYLNTYPQYITNIQGLDIHFIHIKQFSLKRTVPILLVHGWPITPFEYNNVIPYLMQDRFEHDFLFEIVVPSIPGYAYSQSTTKKGLGPYQIGIIFKNLMKTLGHRKFYIHAGDVGQWIASAMAVMYQDDVLGLHTNFPYSLLPQTMTKYFLGDLYPPAVVKAQYASRMYPVSAFLRYLIMNTGYYHLQATRPDTLGKALLDSPSGLASWIIQLIMVGGDGGEENLAIKDGNLTSNYNIDDIFDSLTVYWATQCYTTSARLYFEHTSVVEDPLNLLIDWSSTKVPYAAIKFRNEIFYQPDSFLKDKFPNLVHSSTLDYGGHFAGFQNPDILADSIWTSIRKMRRFHVSRYDDVVVYDDDK